MPTDKLWKYVHMMAQLDAEATLASVSAHAAGAGTMEESDQRRFLQSLRRAATGQSGVTKASEASLAMMGIPVETVQAAGEGE